MDRLQMPGAMPADRAEVLSDRSCYRPHRVDADAAYDRHVQRQLDAGQQLADATDAALSKLLAGYVEPTPTQYDRLERLLAQHRGHALVWAHMIPRSKEDKRWIESKLAPHRVACKALRKRIERMVKRGEA